VATLACGLARSYPGLMAARAAAGLFGGVSGTLVQTIVADAIPYERRGRANAIVMASFSLATVAGVPAGLWMSQAAGWAGTFVAIAALSAAIALLGLHTLPRLDGYLCTRTAAPAPWRSIADVLGVPAHRHALAWSGLFVSAGFMVVPYMSIYLTANAGIDAAMLGLD
jgi:predicted MFS family arabinose efflux permease